MGTTEAKNADTLMFKEGPGQSTSCCRCHPLIPEVASAFTTDRATLDVRGQVELS